MATFKAVKNKAQSRGAMKKSLDYIGQDKKTVYGDQRLVSGHNCVAQSAYHEMLTTKQRFHKTDSRMFYHFVQSFSPEEAVTAEEVHAIGLELAEKLFPDFEVVVATHTDTEHLHNHLVVNSVSWKDGHKLHQNAADLQRQRQVSDEICMAHGLTVLETPAKHTQKKTMRPGEYRSAAKGQSWKFQLINTIDLCMRAAPTKKKFVEEMEKRGYQVRWENNRKAITYTTPTGMRCRDDRLHDKKYQKEVMEREFHIRDQILARRIEAEELAGRDDTTPIDLPHAGTVGGASGLSGRPVSSAASAIQAHAGAEQDNEGYFLRTELDDGADGKAGEGHSGNDLIAPTGWEEERALAFSSAQSQAPGFSPAHAQGAGHHTDDIGGVVRSLLRLGYQLEQSGEAAPGPAPVIAHSDRKTLAKERQKKIAMGHKPDDHENRQQMYL